MYQKGYTIKLTNGNTFPLMKSDFTGDRSFSNAAFLKMLEQIKNTPIEQYPLTIIDLDNTNSSPYLIHDKNEFEMWLSKDFI